MLTRRELLTRTATIALLARSTPAAAQTSTQLCLFSKHLPELAWGDLGRAVKDCGFDGVDLTVRGGGHVLPERAVDDLPRALDAIRAQGVTRADDHHRTDVGGLAHGETNSADGGQARRALLQSRLLALRTRPVTSALR